MPLPIRRPTRAPAPDALPLTERQWQARVERWASDLGWRTFHDGNARRSDPGYPDLTCVHPAHGAIWCELKVGRNTLSPEQEAWRDALVRAGCRWYCWYPADEDAVVRVLAGGAG